MMPAEPAVSVVVTTYNGSLLVDYTIASILAQSFRDFELIIVDDLSTDDTVARIERHVDPRIRLVRNQHNLGVVGSRNVGFSLARGRYIAALDHDDLSMPDRLERQVAYLDAHPGVVLVGSRWLNFSNGQTSLDPYNVTDAPLIRWTLHLSNIMCYSTLMVRTECVRRLHPPMRQERVLADDFDFYHRLLVFGEIARLPEALVIYRLHGSNTFRLRMDEMQHNAALVLRDAYSKWFGMEAGDVSRMMTRLVASREAAQTDRELCRLRDCLDLMARSFIKDNNSPAQVADAILASVRNIWMLALERRIRSGGLSSLRHVPDTRTISGRSWIGLMRSIVFAFVPAKSVFRRAGYLARSYLPAKPVSPVPAGFSRGEVWSDLPSPVWDRVMTILLMVFCIPTLALMLGRSFSDTVGIRSARHFGE